VSIVGPVSKNVQRKPSAKESRALWKNRGSLLLCGRASVDMWEVHWKSNSRKDGYFPLSLELRGMPAGRQGVRVNELLETTLL
jgi:hypothetical protein